MAVTFGQGSFKGFGQVSVPNPVGTVTDDMAPDEAISTNLQLISQNVLQMKQLIESIGTDADSEELRKRVGTIQTATNNLTKDTNTAIMLYSETCPEDVPPTEWKIKKTRLREMFRSQLGEYQELQKSTRSKLHSSLRKSLVMSGVNNVAINSEGEITQDGEQLQLETIAASVDLDMIKEREKELKQIEQDIVDINHIFKDLSQMVQAQGEDIDIIEENVVVAQENIQVANEELKVAHETVARSRCCGCCSCCLL